MCKECLLPIKNGTGSAECKCGCTFRRFMPAAEEVEVLEQYRKQLQGELAGVDERIKELKQG